MKSRSNEYNVNFNHSFQHVIVSLSVLTKALLHSDMRPRPDREGQEWNIGSLRHGSGFKDQETDEDHATGAESRVEREVLLVSTNLLCIFIYFCYFLLGN